MLIVEYVSLLSPCFCLLLNDINIDIVEDSIVSLIYVLTLHIEMLIRANTHILLIQ